MIFFFFLNHAQIILINQKLKHNKNIVEEQNSYIHKHIKFE